MAFDKKLLDILACPACKGKLHFVAAKQIEDTTTEAILVCRSERLVYPIRENIPVLLESEAKQISSDEVAQLLK
ncbi:MAG: hypothetical protein ACI965_002535 [Paraglaciecola sp.]|jgi:uncharacterized protein YbaR (Trm112 family)